ncbi:peptidylprolyl isomerase [Hwanghaeella sp.]|uniref:peptidylprolyl isomerase n=1 Tax=Hwanghaeella sp. TaxID=2605943 RepID=UPI003CCBC9FE
MGTQLFQDIVVNGQTIPFSVVAAETQNHVGPRGVPGTAWKKAANAIAVRAVLLQEAARRGLRPDPQEVAPGQLESEEEALVRQLLDEAIDVSPPDAQAVRREWEKDPDRFKSPPLWDVSHILIACDVEDEEGWHAAHERARAFTRTLLSDPSQFEAVAGRESACSSKSAGGYLGQMRPGDMVPEFEVSLRAMVPGQISTAPVATRFGFHIIRLEAAAEGQVLPFDAVREKISAAMEKAAWAQAVREFVRGLVQAANITGAPLSSG